MNYTMMSYTCSRQKDHFDLRKMLDVTRDLDLAGIDFVTLHGEEAKTLRAMCDDMGVKVVCHTFQARELTSDDPEERKKGLDVCRASFEAAKVLGTGITMIPTPGVGDLSREEGHAAWVRGLAEAAPLAKAAGVTLTVENFPGAASPFVTAADLKDGMEKIDGLKVTYDSGNACTGEDPARSVREVAPHVVHAHFKDWYISETEKEGYRKMLDGRWYKSALIGEGDLDHAAVMKAMQESGCGETTINIEYEGNDYDPYEGTKRAVEYLRGLEG